MKRLRDLFAGLYGLFEKVDYLPILGAVFLFSQARDPLPQLRREPNGDRNDLLFLSWCHTSNIHQNDYIFNTFLSLTV